MDTGKSNKTDDKNYDEIVLSKNFGAREYFQLPYAEGHGGGDSLLLDQIFLKDIPDPLRQSAGTRDGALSALIGIAAVKSCDTGMPIRIGESDQHSAWCKENLVDFFYFISPTSGMTIKVAEGYVNCFLYL